MDSYLDLLGMLILRYGDFGKTDIIIQSIEDALGKIPYPPAHHTYIPTLVAIFYRYHVADLTILPNYATLLKSMGVKSRGFLMHKRKLVLYGALPEKPTLTHQTAIENCLSILLDQFPLSEEMRRETFVLLSIQMFWSSIRPMTAACSILALISKFGQLSYKIVAIAAAGHISPSTIYNQLKIIQDQIPHLIHRPFYSLNRHSCSTES